MSLYIVRNDITKMECDAIVNTANEYPIIGAGCDTAIYNAAGKDELLEERKKIGHLDEGEAAITPGFNLPAKYIIHAVSPLYIEGDEEVERRLRNCYINSLRIALDKGIKSIAFPLISTGSFGYPKEEGLRIAVDEINAFLLKNEMEIYLVVFSDKAKELADKIAPDIKDYLNRHYIADRIREEYNSESWQFERYKNELSECDFQAEDSETVCEIGDKCQDDGDGENIEILSDNKEFDEIDDGSLIKERIKHISDTFSEYLLYLIKLKGMTNAEVYKRAIVDKKLFSKIKNNRDYHTDKMTAMCLCVGARLNLDETRDLLARAGYALSPSNKTDIIFQYFIENEIYDMIELDIQLEENGEKCLIS